MRTFDARQPAVLKVKPRGIAGCMSSAGSADAPSARQPAGAGHGVPLIAQPPVFSTNRPDVGRRGRRPVAGRHEAGAPVRRGKPPWPNSRSLQERRRPAAASGGAAPRNRRRSRSARALMSNTATRRHSRTPTSAACSRKTSAGPSRQKRPPSPCAVRPRRTSTSRAAPRPGRAGRRAAGKCGVPSW